MQRIENGYIFDRRESETCDVGVGLVDDKMVMDVNEDIVNALNAMKARADELEAASVAGEEIDYSELHELGQRILEAGTIQFRFMDLICQNSDIAAEAQRYLDEGWY